ncbi:ral guanine nucleotide dissociation stimulator-like 1 isoform X3 [Cylas formicarius]|uniref:ral guanine nucleotide dissociation stimulator-like 1 isoform X3 n=1 Tax=Cylas formicarius TaxID=197179 RepID=UPI002958D654|nr:ral guanine nucleotide dissociation stimulator-like 1 isoform X3 [Cylas formicarius]
MLLPAGSSNVVPREKSKFFTVKCAKTRPKSGDDKFRFCACTGPRKSKKSAKWYVKPTWRLWGEERTDGALYTVYLKKVRYHRPTRSLSSSHSDSDDEISHLEWETIRVRFVKAATLKKLVEALSTDDGELETTYINVFLATYRSFSTPKEVLRLLLERYEELCDESPLGQPEQHEQHKKTLVSALHVWLDTYPEDFKEAPEYATLRVLLDFCDEHLPNTELDAKVRHRLDRYCREAYADPLLAPPPAFAMRTLVAGWRVFKLPDVPVRHFAEQLTRMDVDLFKKLVPHQCLGAVWSRRDKSRSHEAATVLATVNQFNAVSFRVISSILVEPGLRTGDRAAIIACWIDIAQELRLIKNFSSLKAIISGLQSNPIYRLQKTWTTVPKEKIELFDELARIFSEENNQWTQRELLMKEGTAKFANTVGQHDRQLQKLFQRQKNHHHTANISFGTVPYLGTFLTDLTMIDTAIPDHVADGLINFDKKRKEFEVLAQIKLLQGAANAYHFRDDPAFDRWFDSILVLDDREAYRLSCQIEPAATATTSTTSGKKGAAGGHRKNDSIASTSSSSNGSQFYCDAESSSPSTTSSRMSDSSSSSSSLPSLDASLAGSSLSGGGGGRKSNAGPDFYIIKVTYETGVAETEGVVLYKSIMLSNNERTPQVVRNAMYKLGLEGNPESYTLAQVLPDKEMVLPPNANVYYAVNTAHNLNFVLRPKKEEGTGTMVKNTKKNKS